MNDTRTFATLALLILLTAPGDAFAYRLLGVPATGAGTGCDFPTLECGDGPSLRWEVEPVPFHVNVDAASDATASNLTQADVLGAAQAAAQPWSDVDGSVLDLQFVSETPMRLAVDGVNTVLFRDANQDGGACAGFIIPIIGPLAVTILTHTADGELTDVDIVMNPHHTWEWSTDCIEFDLQSTLVHEFGHMVGLAHTDRPAGAIDTRPTMFVPYFCNGGVAERRTLELDDQLAVSCLYGEDCPLETETCAAYDTGWQSQESWSGVFACAQCAGSCAQTCNDFCGNEPVVGCDGRSDCRGTTAVFPEIESSCECSADPIPQAVCECRCSSDATTYTVGRPCDDPKRSECPTLEIDPI